MRWTKSSSGMVGLVKTSAGVVELSISFSRVVGLASLGADEIGHNLLGTGGSSVVKMDWW